jgi:ethanolamine transporter EutH
VEPSVPNQAGKFTTGQKLIFGILVVLDVLLFGSGISFLVRGVASGLIFAVPVAILTGSLVRGTARIRERRV